MNKLNINSDSQANRTGKISFRRGFSVFKRANLLLLAIIIVFCININSWDTIGGFLLFLLPSEIFILLLSIASCFATKSRIEAPVNSPEKSEKDKTEKMLGLGISIAILSLMSLVFLGVNVPFPSTFIMFIVSTNWMIALFSLVFHPLAIVHYKANMDTKPKSKVDNVFKYITIFIFGLNYHVQVTLDRVPLLINKVVAILFVLLLFSHVFAIPLIFNPEI